MSTLYSHKHLMDIVLFLIKNVTYLFIYFLLVIHTVYIYSFRWDNQMNVYIFILVVVFLQDQ